MSENQSSQIASDSANLSAQASAQDSGIDEWTPANLPGTVQTSDEASKTINATRETELLTLIHDLNDCNDVLLARVSQLEATLGDERKSAQKKSQSDTQNAQQQVAMLNSKLCTE